MALNIAVPLSGVGGLAPISPVAQDCWDNIKILVSPIGSESSGVSSLDSEEAKLQQQKPTAITPIKAQSVEIDEAGAVAFQPQPPIQRRRNNDVKIMYEGRDILDLGSNMETNPELWDLEYTKLPENSMSTYLANRSQYHRLGANGLTPEYRLMGCCSCDFQYPINRSAGFFCQTSLNVTLTTPAMTFTGANLNNTLTSQTSSTTHSISSVGTLVNVPLECAPTPPPKTPAAKGASNSTSKKKKRKKYVLFK